MALLGPAAMLLSFDVVAEAVPDHDRWHTHEHLPERLSIPGFLRGTRWVATRGAPRYLVLYEVAGLATLSSDAYLERLNHPSPWTTRTMPHYRGMRRGFCTVEASFGLGTGHAALLVLYSPRPSADAALAHWLAQELLPALPARAGLGGAHLLAGAATPAMTSEQRIRGADAGVDRAILVTGYDAAALEALARDELGGDSLGEHGAASAVDGLYRFDYALTSAEVAPASPARL